jgi:RND family efflux transporter MFP subunit
MMRLLPIAIAATTLATTACRGAEGKAEAPIRRPVKVEAAQTLAQDSGARYSATIRADEEVSLAFKASGYLDTIAQRRGIDGRSHALQAGDTVHAGEVVARVRDNEYREKMNQAASSLREAEVGQVKAKLDLDRAQALFAAQSLTKPDLDAAQAAFDSGRERVSSARAQLALADIALRDCTLVAPIGGVVLERKVEAGTLVGTGAVGFVIGRITPVKAVFGVPDLLVHRIARGTELDVSTEAFGEARFRGRVTAISPSADLQSRVFNVEITLPNQDGRLKPGMIGRVQVTAGPTAAISNQVGTVSVPLAAVVQAGTKGEQYAVYVVDGTADHTVARMRPVALGSVRGNAVAVIRGLQSGERVVVSGASMLVNGEPVRIIP